MSNRNSDRYYPLSGTPDQCDVDAHNAPPTSDQLGHSAATAPGSIQYPAPTAEDIEKSRIWWENYEYPPLKPLKHIPFS